MLFLVAHLQNFIRCRKARVVWRPLVSAVKYPSILLSFVVRNYTLQKEQGDKVMQSRIVTFKRVHACITRSREQKTWTSDVFIEIIQKLNRQFFAGNLLCFCLTLKAPIKINTRKCKPYVHYTNSSINICIVELLRSLFCQYPSPMVL